MKRNRLLFILFICAFITSCYFFSELSLVILFFNYAFLLVVGIFRLGLALKKPQQKPDIHLTVSENLKLSVLIQVCDEPLKQVYNTIRSICNQQKVDFELIVLLSESAVAFTDQLQKFCSHFNLEVQLIPNYLNDSSQFYPFLYNKIAFESAYVLTLKADYILKPNALAEALSEIKHRQTHAVQFPIGYLNETTYNQGMKEELDHYYQYHLRGIDSFQNLLPNGSIFLIKKEVLKEFKYHYAVSIAEDPSLETVFLENDFKIYHSQSILGWGKMPGNMLALNNYRKRWMLTKLRMLRELWKSPLLPLRLKLASTIRISPWTNLMALPILAFYAGIFLPFSTMDIQPIVAMSIASYYLYFIIQFVLLGISSRFDAIRQICGFMAHMGMILHGAFYWLYFLIFSEPAKEKKSALEYSRIHFLSVTVFLATFLSCCILHVLYAPALAPASFVLFIILSISQISVVRELKKSGEDLSNSIYQIG